MLKENIVEVNNLVSLATLASGELDVLEGLSDIDLISKTVGLKGFYGKLASGLISSLTSIITDETMYYLKNSNKYLQLAMRLMNGTVAKGTPTAKEIDELRNASVKGLGSYVIFAISAVKELSVEFEKSKDELVKHQEIYSELLENMEELREYVEELDILDKFSDVDYLREFNIQVTYGDDEDDEDVGSNYEGSEKEPTEEEREILQWATGVKQAIDFNDFEEEE